jgi:hypothetical protein
VSIKLASVVEAAGFIVEPIELRGFTVASIKPQLCSIGSKPMAVGGAKAISELGSEQNGGALMDFGSASVEAVEASGTS